MGALAEADFLAGMAMCDAVVFPYLEVGQSSSGPISQALELGCRIIASRTHAFLEFAEYHRNAIEFFDIGNHLELAERLTAAPAVQTARRACRSSTSRPTRQTYLLANSRGIGPAPLRRRREPSLLNADGAARRHARLRRRRVQRLRAAATRLPGRAVRDR